MKKNITRDPMYIRRIIKKYDEQLHANKFDNFSEVDQFLERHICQKFTQGKIDCLNSPISIKEIESIIKNLPREKASGPVGSLVNSTKNLREKLYPFSIISSER